MHKILLIGATGKLGSGVLKELQNYPEKYTIGLLLRNDVNFHNSPSVKIFKGDLLKDRIDDAVEWSDLIINCSGFVSYRKKDRQNLYQTNYRGLSNLLLTCEKLNKPLLHTSSAIAYGSSVNPLLFNEEGNYPSVYRGVYAQTKYDADQLIMISNIPWIILRPGTLLSTLKKLYKFYKKGFKAELKGGASFANLDEVSKAYISAVDLLLSGQGCQVFNLGGNNLRFSEVFEYFKRLESKDSIHINSKLLNGLSLLSDHLLEPAFGKSVLTRDNFKTGMRFTFLNSNKAKEKLAYTISPFEHSVKNVLLHDN